MNHRVPPVYILIHGHTDHLVKRHPGALCAERLLASEPSGQLPQHHQCGGHRHQLQGVLLGPRVLRVGRCQNWNFWVVGVDTECLWVSKCTFSDSLYVLLCSVLLLFGVLAIELEEPKKDVKEEQKCTKFLPKGNVPVAFLVKTNRCAGNTCCILSDLHNSLNAVSVCHTGCLGAKPGSCVSNVFYFLFTLLIISDFFLLLLFLVLFTILF